MDGEKQTGFETISILGHSILPLFAIYGHLARDPQAIFVLFPNIHMLMLEWEVN